MRFANGGHGFAHFGRGAFRVQCGGRRAGVGHAGRRLFEIEEHIALGDPAARTGALNIGRIELFFQQLGGVRQGERDRGLSAAAAGWGFCSMGGLFARPFEGLGAV